jgi:hypothetical protein
LKLKRGKPLSNIAFKFNLRRYNSARAFSTFGVAYGVVGRCRLTL